MLTQLRLSGKHLGLLINFGEIHLKHGIERIVNKLDESGGTGIKEKLRSLLFAAMALFI